MTYLIYDLVNGFTFLLSLSFFFRLGQEKMSFVQGVNDAADADAVGPIFSSIELINFEKQQWQWPN